MCRFASFIVTKSNVLWSANDKHETIIKEHKLNDTTDTPDFVRVEITPNNDTPRNLCTWEFHVDQDILPGWTFRGDPTLEARAREALEARAKEERWFAEIHEQHAWAGFMGTASAGDRGTASAGNDGTASAGNDGTASAGEGGTASAGEGGTASAGYRGTASAGNDGTASAGNDGTASAGDRGTASAGEGGTASAGNDGTASAGEGGTILLRWWDGRRSRTIVGYVGENGIKPNTPYRVNDKGELRKVSSATTP